METEHLKFDQWAILEIMGHQRFAGRVTEQTIGGCAFIRLDVPECPGKVPFTKYFGAGSVYALTPIAEDLARGMVAKLGNEPITVFDLPAEMRARLRERPALAAPVHGDALDTLDAALSQSANDIDDEDGANSDYDDDYEDDEPF